MYCLSYRGQKGGKKGDGAGRTRWPWRHCLKQASLDTGRTWWGWRSPRPARHGATALRPSPFSASATSGAFYSTARYLIASGLPLATPHLPPASHLRYLRCRFCARCAALPLRTARRRTRRCCCHLCLASNVMKDMTEETEGEGWEEGQQNTHAHGISGAHGARRPGIKAARRRASRSAIAGLAQSNVSREYHLYRALYGRTENSGAADGISGGIQTGGQYLLNSIDNASSPSRHHKTAHANGRQRLKKRINYCLSVRSDNELCAQHLAHSAA